MPVHLLPYYYLIQQNSKCHKVAAKYLVERGDAPRLWNTSLYIVMTELSYITLGKSCRSKVLCRSSGLPPHRCTLDL